MIFLRRIIFIFAAWSAFILSGPARASMTEYPVVKLQALDKITARTLTFEARIGSTMKYGPLYIKTQTCRKSQPTDNPESAAFLQVWEVTPKQESNWVFSGWMFASSPALSAMDHPVYDVWVLDCLEQKTEDATKQKSVEKEPPAPSTENRLNEQAEDLGD